MTVPLLPALAPSRLALAILAGVASLSAQSRPASDEVLAAFDVRSATIQDLVLPEGEGQPHRVGVVIDGVARDLELQPYDLRSPDFRLLVDDGASVRQLPPPPSVTYRGGVAGAGASAVAVTLIDGQLSGSIDVDGVTWGIQPVSQRLAGARRAEHVLYRHADTVGEPASCGTAAPAVAGGSAPEAAAASAPVEAEVALDLDNLFFTSGRFGQGSVTTAQNVATNILNGVDAIFSRDTGVRLTITTIIVRTSRVYSGTISDRLGQFRSRWNINHRQVRRDFAHLLSGQTGSGVIGVAFLGVVCSASQGYGASQVGFSNSLTSWVGLVAHEAGHQFGSGHCSGSGCFIMCASFNSCGRDVTRFGTSAANTISSFAQSRSCLAPVVQPAPTLTGVTPGDVTSHLPQRVTLTGTGFDGATSVQVGSRTITTFIATATTLGFDLPSPFEIASHQVTVTTAFGTSNALTLEVTGNHPSVLETPSVHLRGTRVDYVAHADAGWVAAYFVSGASGPSAVPGIVSLDIGNGFASGPFQAAVLTASSTGEARLGFTLPVTALPGVPLHWQLITFDPDSPAFPLETSNAAVVPVF